MWPSGFFRESSYDFLWGFGDLDFVERACGNDLVAHQPRPESSDRLLITIDGMTGKVFALWLCEKVVLESSYLLQVKNELL